MSEAASLLKTPLNDTHRALGARMVDFGGWDMPVQYSGIIEEHITVRTAAGLFDVSHMGELEIRGRQALDLVNHVTTNNAAKLAVGQVHYSGLLYEHGGFVDDILVHKVADDHYFLCVNAGNQQKDFEHIAGHNRWECSVENNGSKYAQIAIQGPKAQTILQRLTRTDLSQMKYYWFADGEVSGQWARIARTGYTGEDGFEIYVAPEHAGARWQELMEAGRGEGVKPVGLGARNTLRLEAGMALYGHEIDATITPLEAGLAWIVKFDKGDFLGRSVLEKQKAEGLKRKLCGFEMRGRGIGRDGYEVRVAGTPAGWVTSGGPAPALNKNIGMCYLPAEKAAAGLEIEVMVRNQPVEAVTIPIPFYKRAK
ncbi:MAG: glycine cleavage system aminomethyltransferase GcvT [Acidobacteria bacterium]|nr:glycine cleavage system aminomethyltransferase GcvT [Acidobacteriota bacterium]